MIDFLDTGTVNQSKINDTLCVQFLPNKRENKTVRDMLEILDEGLVKMGAQRSILIQSTKRYPVPCVLIYKGERNK